jgi:hypothetical protein
MAVMQILMQLVDLVVAVELTVALEVEPEAVATRVAEVMDTSPVVVVAEVLMESRL